VCYQFLGLYTDHLAGSRRSLEIGERRRRGDGVSGIFLVSPQNARCSEIGAESRGDVIDE
jgi:hypothetical protein